MTTVRRALALSFLERYLSIVLALGSNMVLARLLTPEQIGIYSVSLAVIGIAHVLRDFGIGNFLIQEKNLTDDHIRTAFGLSLILGLSLAALIFFAAPLIAAFYKAPTIHALVQVVALNFVVLPFCTISMALLRRDMQFKRLLYVNLGALTLGTGTTLTLALWGLGTMSMAIGAVVGNVATGTGAWLARGARIPLRPSLKNWRGMGSFGGKASLIGITSTLSLDANDLIMGKMLGFGPVALISRAQGLMYLFQRDVMGAIRGVMQPAFAQQYRAGTDLEATFVRGVVMVSAIAWPFFGFIGIFSLETLRLMFGPQWDAAAKLVPWFSAAGAVAAFSSLVPTLLIARGNINQLLTLHLLIDPARVVCFGLAIWLRPGLETVAVVFLVFYVASVPVTFWLKDKVQPTAYRELARAIRPSAQAALPPVLLAAAFAVWSRAGSDAVAWPAFLGFLPVYALTWALGLAWARHPLLDEPVINGLLQRLHLLRRPTP
jgi:lipopolysaccharide exporter